MGHAIHVVLLCGGSGTRLWPLSREDRPKQFLKVLRSPDGDAISMAQRTLTKVAQLVPQADITIVTCDSQQATLARELYGSYAPVIEPEQRSTAPAIMLACANLRWSQGADPSDVIIVLPIDGYAGDNFYQILSEVSGIASQESGQLVLLGVKPSSPSTKYGYIIPHSGDGKPSKVLRFIEKPDETVARALIDEGALWNCGVFAFRLSYVMGLLAKYGNFQSFTDVRDGYKALPKQSFDREVVEKARRVTVVPYDGFWTDLGSWESLMRVADLPTIGQTFVDSDNCLGTNVINESNVPVVVSGISDAIIVITNQGILVCSKNSGDKVQDLVERARKTT